MLYFDTSALLPYYRSEPASEEVQALLDKQTEPVLISELTAVEVASALARWVRMQELSDAQANRIESALQEDIRDGRFLVRPLTGEHYRRAYHWLLTRKTPLRTLDALHIACAEGSEAALVTYDETMRQAAEFFGLRVY